MGDTDYNKFVTGEGKALSRGAGKFADWKDSVAACTTGNITLTNEQTVDSVALVDGQRCLVKDHATDANQRIWIVRASAAWELAQDNDNSDKLTIGTKVFVEGGSTNGGKTFVYTAANTWTEDTAAVEVDNSTIEYDGSNQLRVKDAGVTTAKLAAGILSADASGRAKMAADLVDVATLLAKFSTGVPVPFAVTLVSTTAGTAVSIVADGTIPAGKKAYIVPGSLRFYVSGGTAWSGGTLTVVDVEDTNGSPVNMAQVAVAALTGNAFLNDGSANVTPGAAYKAQTGGTTAKGLRVKGDNNAGAGSDLIVSGAYYVK